jgi:hypothetical protein
MPRKKIEAKAKPETKPSKPAAPPTFKSLIKSFYGEGKPRGLKVKKNEAGGYVFSYGTKSAPIAVVASVDEVVAAGLAAFGLKLS